MTVVNAVLGPIAGITGAVAGIVISSVIVPTLMAGFQAGAMVGLGIAAGVVTAGTSAGFAISTVPIVGWVIGAIMLTIAAATAIILAVFGVQGMGSTKEIIVEFKCQPWQAPVGGDDCKKCNEDPLRPCTEYKCRSLGSTCRILDEVYESENPVCINAHPYEMIPPIISKGEVLEEYKFVKEKEKKGVEVRTSNETCIQEFSPIIFTLNTKDGDKEDYARCVYNWESNVEPPTIKNDYDLIGEEFNEGNFYSTTHTFEARLPFVSTLNEVSGNLGERQGEINMYVRCMDYAGNFNPTEYVVNFCIREGQDNTAARIMGHFPPDKSFLKHDSEETGLIVYLDEPAECIWTTDSWAENKSFTSCEDYTEGQVKPRWTCSTTLAGLTEPTNEIYIKCKDQPWLEDVEEGEGNPWDKTNRNENSEGFVYTLYATENPLNITSISPSGEIIGVGTAQVNLEVTTAGGIDNGVSICEYEFIEPTFGKDFFLETNSRNHKQLLIPSEGEYNISVTCYDNSGNQAKKNTFFNITIDNKAPKIVRAYKEDRKLVLITNEKAECYYSTEECFSDLEDGDSMTFGNILTKHSATWNLGTTYYIKCQDAFENINIGCLKIIPGYI